MRFKGGETVQIADGSNDTGLVMGADENGEYYLVCRTYVETGKAQRRRTVC